MPELLRDLAESGRPAATGDLGGGRRGGAQIIPRPDGWRAGGTGAVGRSPTAAGSSFARRSSSRRCPALNVADDVPRPAPGARPSAVLRGPARRTGGRRSRPDPPRRGTLRSHRGEISFPGGRLEPGETPEAGALREAHEEVALDPRAVELLGRLSTPSTVISLSHIVPVVGRLPGRPRLRPAAGGGRAHPARAAGRADRAGVFREERWGEAAGERAIYFFELADETIWGATARILVELLTVVLARVRAPVIEEGPYTLRLPPAPRTFRGSSTPVRTKPSSASPTCPSRTGPRTRSTGSTAPRNGARDGFPAALRRGPDRDRRTARGGQPQAGRRRRAGRARVLGRAVRPARGRGPQRHRGRWRSTPGTSCSSPRSCCGSPRATPPPAASRCRAGIGSPASTPSRARARWPLIYTKSLASD